MTVVRERKEINGLAVNAGKLLAKVCLYSAEKYQSVPEKLLGNDAEVEQTVVRFEHTLVVCSNEFDRIAHGVEETVGKTEAEIFLAQKHVMNDPGITDAIRFEVQHNKKNLEWAITDVYRVYEEKFAKLDNTYLRERSSDFGEIKRRMLNYLYNTTPGFVCLEQSHCSQGKDRVIVAEEMTADMMVHMRLDSVLGIVTEKGGMTSHAAIIARSLGIPAVSGIRNILDYVACGTEIIVDGDKGSIILWPTAKEKEKIIQVERVHDEDYCVLTSPVGTEILANVSLIDDVKMAAKLHADGIGLFRTEIHFMQSERLLSVDEQYDYYKEAVIAMGTKPVTFRLLDVGGDKELPFLRIRKESNPFLGWRGARFLLANADIFSAQVRALLRLTTLAPISILIPMVVDTVQVEQLVTAIKDIAQHETVNADNLKIGIMFEVPSACLQAVDMLRMVDFGSIGSNDLIQYLFAVDRNNDLVSQDYNPEHPILWSVLDTISQAGKTTGKPVSICGEMAGREGVAGRLYNIGIKTLSVSPRLIPRVRNELTRHLV